MARNKMEKEFSEKLSQREITPSAAAWDRLDAMLSSAEAQPKPIPVKRNFNWLFIAASLLGFLLIGTLFFNEKEVKSTSKEIDRQFVEGTEEIAPVEIEMATPQTQIAESEPRVRSQKGAVRKVGHLGANPVQKQQLADNTINHHQPEPIIDQKTNQFNQAQPATDDATIDALLAAAREKRSNNASGAKVNARKLLLEVDSQAEEKLSPRQRALRALNRNYQQVKVAVENRNVEENH
ncbi:hypothetical protein [Flavobacterium selenitireducens]|uniref:hypothetical protein n=1 Tax=Flavobacterium selenitireducens TaxID=2722704 RepID=UPI00168BCA53|nr:hypothetical protein [Flavobacterium selenitireducens]MBD3583263.1 hypothetical protein [Flavobacterium selenitireducens]